MMKEICITAIAMGEREHVLAFTRALGFFLTNISSGTLFK